jgi:GDP-4-dehydro-6-deoxy-D-mannose reductase
VVATRAFNHTGWGRQAVNAESAWARQIVAAERGGARVIVHGDLSARRNFTNVRDVVRAYLAVIGHTGGIYNICSNDTVTMRQVMNTLLSISGVDVPLSQMPGLGTASETGFPKPSCGKLSDATGWEPAVTLAESMTELLEYWRSR